MKIRLKTIMAGPGGSAGPGDVVDVPDDEAAALIEGGYASAVDEPTPAGKKPARRAAAAPGGDEGP
ncbi:MAG: hypothetical protein RL654_110 [Pseudomonadota bacterium]|jgi:hypothetical protein